MPDTKPLRLFFIRHGQTEDFDHPPFNGWRDAPLTDHGRAQLDAAAEALSSVPFDAVYSSDLSRAAYGGECLARLTGLPLVRAPQWREMHFGRWEGWTYSRIAADDRDLIRRIFDCDESAPPFPGGGESIRVFTRRIGEALEGLRRAHPEGGRVALVAHGGVCKVLWGLLLKIPSEVAWKSVRQDFAAVNVADVYPGGFCVAHLVNGYVGPEGYFKAGPGFDRLVGADVFQR